MLEFARKYSGNLYSQNGEDFILREVIRRIGGDMHRCVEFGAHSGTFCSNTANLIINEGWKGKMIEGEELLFAELLNNHLLPEDVDCVNAFITPENVNHFVGETDLLSIDIDGEDLIVWNAYNKKPRVVVIEINSSIHPLESHYSKERGSSYITMVNLGLEKGYFLLCHTGNLIFIDEKYKSKFPEVKGDPLKNWENYFKTDWL